jgi:hypothetical protein
MSKDAKLSFIREDRKPTIESRVEFCLLPSLTSESCLIVSFKGTIDDTIPHAGGYSYMHEMIGVGFAACNPATLILDLRGLEYVSGDSMLRVLDQRIIAKVVVSECNRKGLTNLISNILFLDPNAELFESLDDALAACDSAYLQFLKAGRKRIIAADF